MTNPTTYECPECDWKGTLDTINGLCHLRHIDEHISVGELVPAGACPECNAMIECAEADVQDYVLDNAARIMRQRGWTVIAPHDARKLSATEHATTTAAEGLHEYAFDCALAGAIRVPAADEAAARAQLKNKLDAASANLGAWDNGDPILAEISIVLDAGPLAVPPSLCMIDGEDVPESNEPTTTKGA